MWGQAQAQLQEAVKGKQGGDRKSDEIKRHGVPNDPTVASYGKPTDRKSRSARPYRAYSEAVQALTGTAKAK